MGVKEDMQIRLLEDEERRSIYHGHLQKDFHQSEIKPYSLMEKLAAEQKYPCYGLFDQGKLKGYAFFVKDKKTLLLDYFAVVSEYRNEGLGGQFIRELQEYVSKEELTLFAEVENPVYAVDDQSRTLMKRRIEFYLRNGFKQSKIWSRVFIDEYIIIYYSVKPPVEMKPDPEENGLVHELKQLYQMIFGEDICHNRIHIRQVEK